MIFIHHRINTVEQLKKVPKDCGIELDIRYHQNELILHHDPFQHHQKPYPEKFEDILVYWDHAGPMILNIKTEGIEDVCIKLMTKYKIKNWFFLDLSMPMFAKYSHDAINSKNIFFSNQNLAVRFSEREPIDYALAFKGRSSWVWVDCFSYMPLTKEDYQALKLAGFKICLVSPELQSHSLDYIKSFSKQLEDMKLDAICTKRPDIWKKWIRY